MINYLSVFYLKMIIIIISNIVNIAKISRNWFKYIFWNIIKIIFNHLILNSWLFNLSLEIYKSFTTLVIALIWNPGREIPTNPLRWEYFLSINMSPPQTYRTESSDWQKFLISFLNRLKTNWKSTKSISNPSFLSVMIYTTWLLSILAELCSITNQHWHFTTITKKYRWMAYILVT